jgi:hypothetical protein
MTEVYAYTNLHGFHPEIAKDYGVTTAIIVHHLQYWISHNKRSKRNQHDGKTWMYQTIEVMAEAFPYWSRKQVERALVKAVEQKVIVKGNYNKTLYDRTCWYAFKNELKFGISRKREIDEPKSGDQSPEIGTPIPDTIQDAKQEQQQQQEEAPKATVDEATEKDVVVVFPFLTGIPKLSSKSALSLMKQFTEVELSVAVDKLKASSCVVGNPFGWLRGCIEDDYEQDETKEQRVKANKKVIADCFKQIDGKTVGGRTVSVYHDRIAFCCGGVHNKTHEIHCEEVGFEQKVRDHWNALREVGLRMTDEQVLRHIEGD